jgi:hypothetical protein
MYRTDARGVSEIRPEIRKLLSEWRGPETGRTWPEFCSLSIEILDGDDYDLAVDLVMTDRGRMIDTMYPDDRAGLLSRALATIDRLRREIEETEAKRCEERGATPKLEDLWQRVAELRGELDDLRLAHERLWLAHERLSEDLGQ